MNAPVDVLAIDVVAAIENCAAYLREEMGLIKAADQMGAVGAAVAELIDADREYDAAMSCEADTDGMLRRESARARRRAAIARVGAK